MLETNINNAILLHYSLTIISNDVNYVKYLLITECKLAPDQWVSVPLLVDDVITPSSPSKQVFQNRIFKCHLSHVF